MAATVLVPTTHRPLDEAARHDRAGTRERSRDPAALGALFGTEPHGLTLSDGGIHYRPSFTQYKYRVITLDTAFTISTYRPASVSNEVADFARQVVRAAVPNAPQRAKALMFAAVRLAAFATSVGLPLDPEVVLSDSLIERFICSKDAGSPPTKRTLRTNLRHLARHTLSDRPQPALLPRERAKAPYNPAEIACYLRLSDTQPTVLRRMRAGALICLGAGAGLVGGELRRVRGTDVHRRSGGVIVTVSPRRPRAVPVLSDYHRRLLEASRFFGDRYLVSGPNPDSHNVTNPLIRSLSGGADLPRLDVARLRSTWLVSVAGAIGLRAFMDAAGVRCSQRLGDLVADLDPISEQDAVALLGGRT